MQQQLVKEVRWALLLTLTYVIGWIGFAYFSPEGRGLIGFPIWFEFSCIFLPILFIMIATFVIKTMYKDINLEVIEDE